MTSSPRARSGLRAFSLIEVMLSGAIFLITLAGVFAAFRTSSQMFAHYEMETSAMHVAESVMEELVLRGKSDPVLTDGTTTSRQYNDLGDLDAAGRFTATWSVVGSTPLVGLRTINLTVSWNEQGTPRSVKLLTVRE